MRCASNRWQKASRRAGGQACERASNWTARGVQSSQYMQRTHENRVSLARGNSWFFNNKNFTLKLTLVCSCVWVCVCVQRYCCDCIHCRHRCCCFLHCARCSVLLLGRCFSSLIIIISVFLCSRFFPNSLGISFSLFARTVNRCYRTQNRRTHTHTRELFLCHIHFYFRYSSRNAPHLSCMYVRADRTVHLFVCIFDAISIVAAVAAYVRCTWALTNCLRGGCMQ